MKVKCFPEGHTEKINTGAHHRTRHILFVGMHDFPETLPLTSAFAKSWAGDCCTKRLKMVVIKTGKKAAVFLATKQRRQKAVPILLCQLLPQAPLINS